jgi:Cu2+-exporting ATPase
VVAALRAAGLTTRVCSGDGEAAVADCARACGIDTYQARMTPEAKLALLRELQARGHVVAMIGDGINDAAVLAGADVAIAMGEGAAIAHAAADAVLMGARLGGLLDALAVARHALRIARQSLAWAVGYNAVGIAAAAMGWVPPWVAALGMSASSLAITLNALRVGWGGTTSTRAAPAIEEVAAS